MIFITPLLTLLLSCILTSAFITRSNRLLNFNTKSYKTLSASGSKDNNWELSLASPCKINLFLRILGKRPSGYRKLYNTLFIL